MLYPVGILPEVSDSTGTVFVTSCSTVTFIFCGLRAYTVPSSEETWMGNSYSPGSLIEARSTEAEMRSLST